MSKELSEAIQQLGHPRILVLGDLILDRYIWGEAERVSQEAPVLLLHETRQEIRLGGAANVAQMLRGLESAVVMAGVIGDDTEGQAVWNRLAEQGIDCAGVIVDPSRPTTVKKRFIGLAQQRHPHQILRVDREVKTPIDESITSRMFFSIRDRLEYCDAVLISDYAKGVCTLSIVQQVIALAQQSGKPVIVDPASSGDFRNYRGATAITPNRLETRNATGLTIQSSEHAFRAGKTLIADLDLAVCFVTLDSDGIACVDQNGHEELLPTRKREVYDITGAGDMVLAMVGLGLASNLEPGLTARLANVAGGLEVEQVGVVTISREEILQDILHHPDVRSEKIYALEELQRLVKAHKEMGHRIVFTNGCFDLLHIGHVTMLQEAAQEGDCLIVGMNSDASIRQLEKASDRPIIPEVDRASLLAALQMVDYVVMFDEPNPEHLLRCLKPDVLVKGGTYSTDEIVGKEIVESYGGLVKPLGVVEGQSTSNLLDKIRQQSPTIPISLSQDSSKRKAG